MNPTTNPATAPLPSPVTTDGWVTLTRTYLPGVGQVLVQKRDGCTRSIPIGR